MRRAGPSVASRFPIPPGKLPPDELARFLSGLPQDESVLVGPTIGEDAAVLRIPASALLIAATDPITFPTAHPGWSAVHVNANDVATRGGVPRWFLATVLLPPGTHGDRAGQVLRELAAACAEIGATLVGGHTEVTPTVTSVIINGCMLGTVAPELHRRSGAAQVGDALLLAGWVGVEGTSVLATAARPALLQAGVPEQVIAAAAGLVERFGISVVPAARLASPVAHALHDLTEGGLVTAVRELALASGTGASIAAGKVPVRPETQAICAALGLDPLGLLSSGALLIAVPAGDAGSLLSDFTTAGLPAAQVGALTAAASELLLERDEQRLPLPEFARDELARWLEQ